MNIAKDAETLTKCRHGKWLHRRQPDRYVPEISCEVYDSAFVGMCEAIDPAGQALSHGRMWRAIHKSKFVANTGLASHRWYKTSRSVMPWPKDVLDRDVLRRPVFYAFYPWSCNYQHWVIEDLSRLWFYFALRVFEPELALLLPSDMHPWRLAALDMLGIDEKQRVCLDGSRWVECEKLYVSSFPALNFGSVSLEAWQIYDELSKRATAGAAYEPKKIFVSRDDVPKDHWHQRVLDTEAELASVAERFGYEKIAPSTLSFRDEVGVFARATHVAGAVGAGMCNVVWCQNLKNGVVVDHPRCSADFFVTLARGRMQRLGGANLLNDEDGVNVPWTFPPHLFERAIIEANR